MNTKGGLWTSSRTGEENGLSTAVDQPGLMRRRLRLTTSYTTHWDSTAAKCRWNHALSPNGVSHRLPDIPLLTTGRL